MTATDWKKQHLIQPFEPEQLLSLPIIIAYDEGLPLIRQYFAQVFRIKLDLQAVVTVAD